jgi:phosphate transport system substrate-binding protein
LRCFLVPPLTQEHDVIERVAKLIGVAVVVAVATAAPARAQDLNGAGATFPQPIYNKWFAEYKAAKGVEINYQGIGSGGGIKALQEGTVDFGASDAPMSDDEMSKLKTPALHIPTVIGAVVVTYNLPEVTKQLMLTGPVVADIYLGKVTKWNAPEIAALNKGVTLPNKDILVVHRTDASGTTYIFTDYLTAVSPAWASGPGKGKDVKWAVGLGGAQNAGVMGQVRQIPGSIGYVELAYAKENKVPYAALKNAAGKFVDPSIGSVTAAAAGAVSKLPPTTDFRVSIVNAPGADAYPISSFTYLLVYEKAPNAEKGKKLVDFLKWALHDGEKDVSSLNYAPLPTSVVAILDKRVASLK